MVKKLLSLILASLMILSCVPIDSQAAEIDEASSSASTISITAEKGELIDVIVSIGAVNNVQGLLLDLDKAYSKFQYQGYEVMDDNLNNGSVFVNSSPVDYVYTDIYASVQFPDGGVTYREKTDILKFTFKARSAVTDFEYNYTVKELYNSSLNDLSSNLITVRASRQNETETQTVLSSITVVAPNKTTYYKGESLDKTGMKVTAKYSDNTSKDVTSSASLSGFDSSTTGTKTITVSYTEGGVTKSATFNVTVKEVELSSIAVTTLPSKTTYYVGESFSSAGVKVTATYGNGTTADVTSGTKFDGFDSSTVGTKTITATYNGKTTTFSVTVKAVEVSSITVTTKPTKTEYYVGESFSSAGIKVTATYNNGNTKDVTSSVSYSGFSSTTAGTKTVTVSYGGKTTSFTVTVKAVEVTKITITTKPTKTEYYVGESFSSAGAKITATYNNGTTADVTSSTSFSGFDSSTSGTKTITAAYSGKTATFTVTVSAVTVSSISVKTAPSKTTYYVGDTTLDTTGLVITAAYNNGTTKDITSGWTTSGFDANSVGTKTITVTYSGKTTTFKITVKAALVNNSSISINGTVSTNGSHSMKIGETATVTGSASGGSGDYKYAFYYKVSTSSAWTTSGTEYGSATTMTFSPVNAGTYDVKVNVKDSDGHIVTKTFNVTVDYSDLQITSFTVSPTENVCIGDTITLAAAAKGGTGSYTYAYSYKKTTDSKWTAAESSFMPSAVGAYQFKVTATDKNDSSRSTEKVSDVTVTVGASLTNTSTVDTTQHYVGDTVTISGAATGGTASYKYTYSYKKSSASSWTTIGSANTTNQSASFTVTDESSYNVKVDVTDAKGRTASKTFTINVGAALSNTSVISTDKAYVNDAVTITGSAAGGSGSYTYTYSYKKSTDSAWTTIGAANTNSAKAIFAPTEAVVYNIKVVAKDSRGKTAEKVFSVTVYNKPVNESTIDLTTVQIGKPVKVTGKSTGGMDSISYEFAYKKSTDSSWTVNSEYGKATSASFTFDSVGSYNIRVNVKDSKGTVASKTFTVTVNEKLQNNSTVNYTAVQQNVSIRVNGKATGGVGSYQFEFAYKTPGASDFVVKSTYGAASAIDFTPGTVGTYIIRVNVKDSNKTEETKTFEITVTEPLQNVSTVNYTTVQQNASVRINGKATGGVGSYKYKFEYKTPDASEWKTKSDYGKATDIDFTPGSVGIYKIRVSVKDAYGTIESKTLNLYVNDVLTNTSKLSHTEIQIGQAVTATGASTGGVGSNQYEFSVKRPGTTDWIIEKNYSTESTFKFTPNKTGIYQIKVLIKDKNDTKVQRILTFTAKEELQNNSTVSNTKVQQNTTIKINGKADKGVGSYKYEFSYKKPGASDFVVKSSYGNATAIDFTPSSIGTYTIRVNVKDSNGTVVTKTFEITVTEPLKNVSTVNKTIVQQNASVRINGKATGGVGSNKYEFSYKKPGASDWDVKSAYGKATDIDFTPGTLGTYGIRVNVKDGNGTVVTKTFEITVVEPLQNVSTVNKTTVQQNTSVRINGKATGGVGSNKYEFSYKKPGTSVWVVKSAYGKATDIDFTPSSVGTYEIKVNVKDGNDTIVTKTFEIIVTEPLQNVSTVNKTIVQQNAAVRINGKATGGVGSYKYEFSYKKPGASDWAVKSAYGKATDIDFAPSTVGTYTIKVDVKDGNDTIVTKTFEIIVTEPLQNVSTVNKTTVKQDESIRVNGKATGGVGSNKYEFSYKKPGASDWVVKSAYGKATAIDFSPSTVGTYTIKVDVKDGNNTVVTKTFTINVTAKLQNTSTVSKEKVQKGTTITISGSAVGGAGNYSYEFSYKKPGENTWTVKSAYGEATKITLTPMSVGDYKVKVNVKDSDGNVVSKEFTITVTE